MSIVQTNEMISLMATLMKGELYELDHVKQLIDDVKNHEGNSTSKDEVVTKIRKQGNVDWEAIKKSLECRSVHHFPTNWTLLLTRRLVSKNYPHRNGRRAPKRVRFAPTIPADVQSLLNEGRAQRLTAAELRRLVQAQHPAVPSAEVAAWVDAHRECLAADGEEDDDDRSSSPSDVGGEADSSSAGLEHRSVTEVHFGSKRPRSSGTTVPAPESVFSLNTANRIPDPAAPVIAAVPVIGQPHVDEDNGPGGLAAVVRALPESQRLPYLEIPHVRPFFSPKVSVALDGHARSLLSERDRQRLLQRRAEQQERQVVHESLSARIGAVMRHSGADRVADALRAAYAHLAPQLQPLGQVAPGRRAPPNAAYAEAHGLLLAVADAAERFVAARPEEAGDPDYLRLMVVCPTATAVAPRTTPLVDGSATVPLGLLLRDLLRRAYAAASTPPPPPGPGQAPPPGVVPRPALAPPPLPRGVSVVVPPGSGSGVADPVVILVDARAHAPWELDLGALFPHLERSAVWPRLLPAVQRRGRLTLLNVLQAYVHNWEDALEHALVQYDGMRETLVRRNRYVARDAWPTPPAARETVVVRAPGGAASVTLHFWQDDARSRAMLRDVVCERLYAACLPAALQVARWFLPQGGGDHDAQPATAAAAAPGYHLRCFGATSAWADWPRYAPELRGDGRNGWRVLAVATEASTTTTFGVYYHPRHGPRLAARVAGDDPWPPYGSVSSSADGAANAPRWPLLPARHRGNLPGRAETVLDLLRQVDAWMAPRAAQEAHRHALFHCPPHAPPSTPYELGYPPTASALTMPAFDAHDALHLVARRANVLACEPEHGFTYAAVPAGAIRASAELVSALVAACR